MKWVLLEGAILGEDATVAQFREKVLALESALGTFVTSEGLEPTNYFMERLSRRAVLWRKRGFGCWSQEGCRFVARIMTVVQTRRCRVRMCSSTCMGRSRPIGRGNLAPNYY